MSFSIKEVAELLKQAKENKKPYVFFTGAGCSISAGVPSATGLIEEIRSQFPIQVKNIDHDKDRYNYGKYMSALDKDERRRLLKPHIIDNKHINWAHIALACLMKEEYIQRVLTFNFDSILSRACNLLGLHPSIYDFATANPHLYHLINDPAIVHLHGQGTGFIQLNTQAETQKHTEKLGDFIAATLNSNPSLFIGYSGNADEFFPLLKDKYSEQHRLIWTGRKNNIDDIEAESVKEFLQENQNLTHYIGDIDADHFLIQLAKELDCFPPQLFLNPYDFLNTQLQNIQPYPLADGLDILENLSKYLKQQAKQPLIESLYTAFIHKYPDQKSTQGLNEKAIDEIMWAYDQQAEYLVRQEKFEESFRVYEQALGIIPTHLGCLNNYAITLYKLARIKEDQTLFEQALKLYEKALRIESDDADTLGNYALALLDLALIKQHQTLFEKAFEYYEKALAIEPDHANNLGNYGNALLQLARIKQDQTLFEKAFEQYEKALRIEPDDADTLGNYGSALSDLARLKQDQILFEQAFEQYEKALRIEPNHARRLGNYAAALSIFAQLKQDQILFEKAFEQYEKALRIEPDHAGRLENFAIALTGLAQINKDHILFEKALEKYEKALQFKPNETYNLACYYAVLGKVDLCQKYVLHAENHNTLPLHPYQHLIEDQDLDSVRHEEWFIELLKRLEAKQHNEVI